MEISYLELLKIEEAIDYFICEAIIVENEYGKNEVKVYQDINKKIRQLRKEFFK